MTRSWKGNMVKSEALIFLVEIFFKMVLKRVRIERTFKFNAGNC